MCNALDCSHDLDDSLDDIFASPLTDADRKAGLDLARAQPVRVQHEEKCNKCNGSGRFVGYTGRVLGQCFACKGKGTKSFRTSVAQRERATELRNQRKEREQMNIAEQAAAWKRANPNEAAWLANAAGRGFEFAVAMEEALLKWGTLTPNQAAAVTRATAKWIESTKARAARVDSAPTVEIGKIEQAFASAQDKGIKRPKITLTGIKFSLAPATGKNAGSIYVVATETDQYLGRITGGRFITVRECSPEQEAEVLRVAADPHAAAVAHGQRTGNCCICNRELTNHASIDAGVGPVCAARFGW
jgi:hypothetical protein